MGDQLATLDIRDRKKWRAWLEKHHASSPGVWLLFHKDHTGVESVPYEDAVRLALCFGWIDSSDQANRRRALRTEVHAEKADEQVVGSQPQALGRARGARAAHAGGRRRRADRQSLRSASGDSQHCRPTSRRR